MPKNRKYYPHNSVLFVTSRTEEGLPMVASLQMNFIIWGILASARSKYKVKVCHFIFMFNHFHMLIVVDNPEHVCAFIGYVKTEIAHAINRLLGRRQKTIWTDGYDSPLLLTAEDVLKYITYIYSNPSKSALVERIEDYPGVSSWEMFISGTTKMTAKRLKRVDILRLALPALTINEQKRLINKYELSQGDNSRFILEPWAWVECFSEVSSDDIEKLKQEVISRIRNREQEYAEERRATHRTVIGATQLRRQSMLKEYVPSKYSRRMVCICSDRQYRKEFLCFYRGLCAKASLVFEAWKRGELSLKIPPGLFAPRMPVLCAALCL